MTNGDRQASACLSFCGRVIFEGDFALRFQQREAFERKRGLVRLGWVKQKSDCKKKCETIKIRSFPTF